MKSNLKSMREAARLTQEQLAERSGVSRTTISAIENNDGKAVSTKTLLALAKALNTTVKRLFWG